jgi:hypothetical protein
LAKVAARLGLDPEVVKEVYHVEGDKFEIVVPVARLDTGFSRATKQIALLIPAARQASGMAPNFASAVKETAGLQFRQENRKTMVRVTRPGFEAATALVRRLAGVES